MKKAQVLSTICISALSLSAGTPTRAQVPGPDACFTRSYDPAHLARNPQQGVRALRMWFHDAMRGDPSTRSVIVEAAMADQGQAVIDGVAGLHLRQISHCSDGAEGTCYVECDGGGFSTILRPGGELEIVTDHYVIGDVDGCGGISNLAEGGRTVYRLTEAPVAACSDLALAHPLPEPGCYAVDYPQGEPTGLVTRMVIRLDEPDLQGAQPAFPWVDGVLAVDVAAKAGVAGAMAGRQALIPIWCSSMDARCRSGMDSGHWTVSLNGAEVILEADFFGIHGPDDVITDLAQGAGIRHVLSPLGAEACDGLVLE